MVNILSSLGYEIANKTNLSGYVHWQNMRDAIIDYFNDPDLRQDDTVIFYYSGHGVPDANGNIYFATSEIDPYLPGKRGVSFDELTRIMQGSTSCQIVAILDCCYSGSAKISKGNEDDRAKLGSSAINRASKILRQGEGICLLASSQSYQEAYNLKEQHHSLFTYFLLEGLKGDKEATNNGFVTVDSLSNYVYDKIMELPEDRRPKQKPLRKVEASGDIILAYHPQFTRLNEQVTNSVDSSSLILKGKEFLDNKDYQTAFEYWDDITHKFGLPEAWYYKGLAVANLGKPDEAIRCFDVCIQSDPTNADAWESKGVCLINKNQIDEALTCIEKSIAFTKTSEKDLVKCNRWFSKGYCLETQKNYTEALECYDKSIGFFPNAKLAISKKGDILLAQGNVNQAEPYFDKALELDPNLSVAHFGKGRVRSAQKNDRDAIPYFDKAIEMAKKNKQIANIDVLYLSKGTSQFMLKEYEQALESLSKALEINPKNVDILFSKAVTLEALERFEEALSYYDKVIKLNPKYSDASIRKQNIIDFLASSGGRHYDSDGNVV
jgi:tetratricopeptide (TPR) repeat protein